MMIMGKKVTFPSLNLNNAPFSCLLIAPTIEFGSHENTVPFLKTQKKCSVQILCNGAGSKWKSKEKKAAEPEKQIEYSWVFVRIDLKLT